VGVGAALAESERMALSETVVSGPKIHEKVRDDQQRGRVMSDKKTTWGRLGRSLVEFEVQGNGDGTRC